ncbi:MAG: PhnD/SsuA/transferrin family substrate-binding protein, partial [candidate division WOR-3 bacterium]
CDKLSCDCVKGYAQRKYEKLGEHLEAKLGRPVKLFWSESLTKAMKEESDAKADLIIGKHSVVLADAKAGSVEVVPIASLTDNNGKTTQTGLFIERSDDPAKSVSDLKGYRILFGPADCDEKYAAPMALLKEHGVDVSDKPEILATCRVAATKLMELPENEKAAAVIEDHHRPPPGIGPRGPEARIPGGCTLPRRRSHRRRSQTMPWPQSPGRSTATTRCCASCDFPP